MAWIESHQSLQRHPKTITAAAMLGITRVQMIGHLHCLWWWALEQLQTIIDHRYINALPLVITTNRPLDDLFKADSDPRRQEILLEASGRIASRFQRESWCRAIVLDSKEHRLWE